MMVINFLFYSFITKSFINQVTYKNYIINNFNNIYLINIGKLKTNHDSDDYSKDYLPTLNLIDNEFSSQCANSLLTNCFFSGTEFTNFLPSITAIHTIFVRHHNFIANKILVFYNTF